MKKIFIDSLQIHDNAADIGYAVRPPIAGLEAALVRTVNYNRAGEHGSIVANQLYGERRITLEGYIFGSSIADYETKRRALENAVKIVKDSDGAPIPKVLKFTTMDNLALQVKVYPVNPIKMAMEHLEHATFLLDLLAPDFVLEDQSQSQVSVAVPSGGGAVLPWIMPITFAAATGGTITAVNNGNAEAYPTITFNGPLNNPRLYNRAVGREMALTHVLAAGEQIVIDMREKTIIQGGTTNQIAKKTAGSKWWWLAPGDNVLDFATSVGGDTGNCQIAFRHSFVGV